MSAAHSAQHAPSVHAGTAAKMPRAHTRQRWSRTDACIPAIVTPAMALLSGQGCAPHASLGSNEVKLLAF